MKRKKIVIILIYFYIITTPFYIFNSGLPQISDIIIAIAIITYFNGKFEINKRIFFLINILFIYILLINSYWFMNFLSNSFLLSTIFYFYNFIILIFFIGAYKDYKEELLNNMFKALSISLILQFILSFFYSNNIEGREYLFFNNPNQLGYYTILTLTLIIFISLNVKIKIEILVFLNIIVIYLAILSLSKSAIILTIILLMFQIINTYISNMNTSQILKITFILFLSIGTIYLNADKITESKVYKNVEERITSIDVNTKSNFEERRYNRIIDNKKYWVFGAGEGAFQERFNSGEIHSTFFSFFFNYGIIGTIILITLVVFLLKNSKKEEIFLFFILVIYGLTHNGIRQSLFWVLLALIYAINEKRRRK